MKSGWGGGGARPDENKKKEDELEAVLQNKKIRENVTNRFCYQRLSFNGRILDAFIILQKKCRRIFQAMSVKLKHALYVQEEVTRPKILNRTILSNEFM